MIDDLFEWLKQAKDHLLIRSCVFHYEFEFIHPFSDGNGRMGRLWQSLILGRLHPLFEYLPVPVPDYRLGKLSALYNSEKITPAVIEFVDIAGLVKGASKGEGLGNQRQSRIGWSAHRLGNFLETSPFHHLM